MTGLAQRWLAALPGAVDRVAARRIGADLIARWSEPHRFYHTRRHLAFVLSIVDANATAVDDPGPVRLADWYHDAVYDPWAADNEERSALLAEQQLGTLGLPAETVAETARLVRLTATHEVADSDRNGALLSDADLAILAATPPRYNRYCAAVRREYAHVPEEAFRAGRTAVLRHLLALPSLYRIVAERVEWTARARANLSRELRRLEVGRPLFGSAG